MRTERKWAIVWGIWTGAFVVAESIALANGDPHAPLSHHMRRALGVRKQSVHHRLGQVAFASSVGWLAVHLWRGVTNGPG